jgi:phosphoserine phosphatase
MDAMEEPPRTLLITLTGTDRPGVTSTVFSTLAAFGVAVLDIEQIVLRRRLVLGVLVTVPRDWKALRDAVQRVGSELEMQVEVDRGTGDNRPRPEGRSHVTVLGTPLRPAAVAAIAGRIADTGANIDRIERMARYPVTAIELHVSGVDPDRLRATLAAEAAVQAVDVAVQPANLLRHGMRLVVMDVDSTLVQG